MHSRVQNEGMPFPFQRDDKTQLDRVKILLLDLDLPPRKREREREREKKKVEDASVTRYVKSKVTVQRRGDVLSITFLLPSPPLS